MCLKIEVINDDPLTLNFIDRESSEIFYAEEAEQKLKEQRYLREDFPPDYRFINGIDTDTDGLFDFEKYLYSIEILKSRKEKMDMDRDPEIGDWEDWVLSYQKIFNDKEAMRYLEKTIRLLLEKNKRGEVRQNQDDKFEQLGFFQ